MKRTYFADWFMRRISGFPDLETRCANLEKRFDDALDLRTAAINKLKTEIEKLRKKAESDAALIESLNRYIEALEGKAKMQEEKIKDMSGRLETVLAAYENLAG